MNGTMNSLVMLAVPFLAFACRGSVAQPGTAAPAGWLPEAGPDAGQAAAPRETAAPIEPHGSAAPLATAGQAAPLAAPLGTASAPTPSALALLGSPWSYIMPVDHGVRADKGGKGFFRAPRSHGEHNGLDLLAPVGTSLLAPCAGRARSGSTGGFGKWVHVVCPVPSVLGEGLHASLFYAHMDSQAVARDYVDVAPGAPLGAVGKTGNAIGPRIAAHVHFEVIVHESEQAALDETHSGLDQSNNPGADRFFELLDQRCLRPSGLRPLHNAIRRQRRADPFLVMSCLTLAKPPVTQPASPLGNAFVPWRDAYTASAFDVNFGRSVPLPSAPMLPAPPPPPPPPTSDSPLSPGVAGG